jgi:hypothetical protein
MGNSQINPNQTQTVTQSQFDQIDTSMPMDGACYLTPDSLMAYCQSRLQGLDSQVNEAFVKQQHANQVSAVLSKLLGDPAMSIPGDKLTGQAATDKIEAAQAAIKEALTSLDPNSTEAQALKAVQENLGKLAGKDLQVSDFQNVVVNAVSDVQKNLNSGSELSMISLQSLVSQRQQAIQVCTNLIQSLGDQCNKIAENIGK